MFLPKTTAGLTLDAVLEAVTTIARQTQAGSDLDTILQQAIAVARAHLQADRVIIYRFVPDRDAVILFESVGEEWTPILGQLIYDPCFEATWVDRYRQGCTTQINDIHDGSVDACYVALLDRFQVQANLVVPILWGEAGQDLWGLLIAHQCRSPRQWQSLEVQFLQQMALHLGLSIQQAALSQSLPVGPPPWPACDHCQVALERHLSESQFQALVTNMPGMVYRYFPATADHPHYFSFVSTQAQTLLELSPATLLADADALVKLIHPEDLSSFLTSVAEAVAHVRPWRWEGRITTPSGQQKWIQGNSQAQPSLAGAAWDGLLVDISDRKRAEVQLRNSEEILRQQADREHLLIAIAQRIRQTLDLDEILNTTVQEVQQFLRTDRVLIYRFEPDWSGTVITESVVDGWASILDQQITDTYFVENQGGIYQLGQVKATADIYAANFSPCHVEFLEKLQVKALLVVPILQDEKLWGLLVAQQCRSPRQWQPLETDLLQQLATQIAIAIHQSELYEEVQLLNAALEVQVQERTAQLQQALNFEATLKRITDQVRDSLDEGHILQNVVRELAIATHADCCDTTSYSTDHTVATVEYEYHQGEAIVKSAICSMSHSSDPNLYVHLLRGEYCHFCLIGENVIRPDQPRKTILACPVVDDQGVLGDLWLFRAAHTVFNDLEIRLVQQVANQCAIALRQSRLYQAAQAQVKELERLNQLKDDFLSTVSHELRTPMSNIKMATQMLEISLRSLGIFDDDPKSMITRYFKVLCEEGQREINLINDLLDLTRLDAGVEAEQKTTIALQYFIPYLAEPFIERSRNQKQRLEINIDADVPALNSHSSYLERIVTELLNNACKYTPAGEVITISVQRMPSAVELQVCNSGVDVPPAECDRIFDKFYRIPNNDPWKHGGTGLGLALVKKLTEHLGGTIRVECRDRCLCFSLQFPV